VISVENRKVFPPHAFLAPADGVRSPRNSAYGLSILELRAVRRSRQFQDRFSRLDTIPTCDRQTDRQTRWQRPRYAQRRAGKIYFVAIRCRPCHLTCRLRKPSRYQIFPSYRPTNVLVKRLCTFSNLIYIQAGICRGKQGNFPLTGSDLPSHWFVCKLRGMERGRGGKGKGGGDRLPYSPPLASASNTILSISCLCQGDQTTLLHFNIGHTYTTKARTM